MLIIRSQDKTSLIVDDVVYWISREDNKYLIYVTHINDTDMRVASYSTKEKALKVLDMLEAFINEDYEKLHNLGYKNGKDIPMTFVDFNSLHKPLDRVFRFPKNEEVEV